MSFEEGGERYSIYYLQPKTREELARRRLTMLGAFVPVRLKDPGAHDEGEAHALRVARLLAAVANIDKLRATDYTVRFGNPGDPPQV
jgi:hypothetical protein